jgi:hypothetical protein
MGDRNDSAIMEAYRCCPVSIKVYSFNVNSVCKRIDWESSVCNCTYSVNHWSPPFSFVAFFFFVHSSYTVLLRCPGFSFFFGSIHNRQESLDEWSARRKASTSAQDNTTQNKRTHTPNIHAVSGIRTHDHSVRVNEDSSFLRPLGYRDWPLVGYGEEIGLNGTAD